MCFFSEYVSIESRKKKIYTYWKKICDDEKIASSRNSMLLIELEKLDNHLAFMKQQTQKMDFFKVLLFSHLYYRIIICLKLSYHCAATILSDI